MFRPRFGAASLANQRVVPVPNVPKELARIFARLLEPVQDELPEEARAAPPADPAPNGRVQVALCHAPHLVRRPVVSGREADHYLRHGLERRKGRDTLVRPRRHRPAGTGGPTARRDEGPAEAGARSQPRRRRGRPSRNDAGTGRGSRSGRGRGSRR